MVPEALVVESQHLVVLALLQVIECTVPPQMMHEIVGAGPIGLEPLQPRDALAISTLADDLASFVRGVGLGPVTIVGWSFGGGISLTMAVRNRGLVTRMFLYEPTLSTFLTEPDEARVAVEDRAGMMKAAKPLAASGNLAGAVRMFMDGVNAEDGAFDRLAPEVRKMMNENARMLPLLFAGPPPPSVTAADLRTLDCPVTIALGELSRVGYQIPARAARSLLPFSRGDSAGREAPLANSGHPGVQPIGSQRPRSRLVGAFEAHL
jgi:pimeloyl-ACP methyl ester carboxylesterase